MHLEQYELIAGAEYSTYYFISVGLKGEILKRIEFQPINEEGLFNLAFGDYDAVQNKIEDTVVSNNSDTDKVLATVASAVSSFLNENQYATVYATGSTPSRTRLYQMGINRHYKGALTNFDIYGQTGNHFEHFMPGKKYIGFLVQKKIK